METITSLSLHDTERFAGNIMAHLRLSDRVICLSGDLGSGKTTLTQGMLRYCGAEGPYTSPTFAIMKQYVVTWRDRTMIYHIDAYRIGSGDMVELGWQEIIDDPHNLIIVEWPEHIADLLPQDALRITCAWINDTTRTYTINK